MEYLVVKYLMTILFTPLDIPIELPDETELYNWATANTFRQTNYKQFELGWFTHSPVACCIQPNDWRDVGELYRVEDYLKNQYVGGETVFHPEFAKLFPALVNAIKAMPFKELTGASVKIQRGPSFPHIDDLHSIEEEGLTEPKRITVSLTNVSRSTLYLQKDDVKMYTKIPEGYPCYAFNNKDVFHAADYDPSSIRIILDTAGMLDAKKHKELIERSIEKFKEYVIYDHN
jgi:hypothetical protein